MSCFYYKKKRRNQSIRYTTLNEVNLLRKAHHYLYKILTIYLKKKYNLTVQNYNLTWKCFHK